VRRDDISEVTSTIWRETLGIDVEAEPEAPRRPRKGDSQVTGVVRMDGAWKGTLKVECSPGVARRLAARMFEKNPEDASQGDIEDAVGEMTNMTGGNIKALVPGPSRLSLPMVGEEAKRETRVMPVGETCQVQFRCPGDEGEGFTVTLLDETGADPEEH